MPHPHLLMNVESFDLNRIRMMKHLVAARHSHSGCATRVPMKSRNASLFVRLSFLRRHSRAGGNPADHVCRVTQPSCSWVLQAQNASSSALDEC
jgi:hypothetical protein